jgi:hypothetical protein
MRNPCHQLLLWDEPHDHPGRLSGEPGPPCLKCGAPTFARPGTPPHYARIDCTQCKEWRWLPKPLAARGGKP